MIFEKNHSMHLKFNLQAIPVCLVALVLWAVIGGWYTSVAPKDMAGPDNTGIVFSIFGLCLFFADRLALLWLSVHSQIIVFATWLWGLIFMFWGLFEWLHSFSKRYLPIFILHWTIFLIIIAILSILVGHSRNKSL